MMARLVGGLGVLVLVCVMLRVAAWLVTPILPLLTVLFVVAALLTWLVRPYSGRRRWR